MLHKIGVEKKKKTRWQLQANANGFPLKLSRGPSIKQDIITQEIRKFENSSCLGLLGKWEEVHANYAKHVHELAHTILSCKILIFASQ